MNVIPIRPLQTAVKRFSDRPNVLKAIKRAIVRDLREGLNGQAPLHKQRLADRVIVPKEIA